MPEVKTCGVLVVGDEVESILTAVSAARSGVKVILARRSTGRFGGLSVRGGLSYMDITPEFVTGLFQEFLKRTGLIRVALNPDRAHAVLSELLQEAGIEVFSGVEVQIETDEAGFPCLARLEADGKNIIIEPQVVIDATPDADVARSLGIPYVMGLGGILGEEQNFLGVSPVFRIEGVSVDELRAFEEQLRQQPELSAILEKALPYHPPKLRSEYITRTTFAPEDMDYIDILNPVIGIDYHIWRHGNPESYANAGIFIDGGNISRLADGSLGFNGLVAKASALDLDFDDLIAMSQGGPIPEELRAEMKEFERYLRERAGFPEARVIPPAEMYVRQTLTLLAKDNMTARKAIEGGVPAERSIGTFSYWLDLRGAMLWKHFPGEDLSKPVFNVGLDVALPLHPRLQNFGFVSRSAGYSPIGQGTGRIVQHNALLGEGLGVAAALAVLSNTTLEDITEHAMPQVQKILHARREGDCKPSGHSTWTPEQIAASELLRRDEVIIVQLRAQVTDFLVF
ncbi:MAG TPA: FAD-dependent oxidoreductase [Coleofasciculaceae cyanobacterium]|jgi:hypothetical protein